MQDLSKEQAETHKVLVQPALEAAAAATVNILQQLIRSTTEQVCLPPRTCCDATELWKQHCLAYERALPLRISLWNSPQLYTTPSSMYSPGSSCFVQIKQTAAYGQNSSLLISQVSQRNATATVRSSQHELPPLAVPAACWPMSAASCTCAELSLRVPGKVRLLAGGHAIC